MSRFMLLSAVVLFAAALPAQAGGEFDPRETIGKAVETMGGAAVLDGVQGMAVKARGAYQGMPYTTENIWLGDGRMLWKLDAGVFQASMGTDGKVVWSQFGSPPARVQGAMKKSISSWQEHRDIILLRPLLRRKDVEIEARSSMSGTPAKEGEASWTRHLVRVTFPSGLAYDLVFHTEGGVTRFIGLKGDMIHWDGRRGSQKWKLAAPKKFGDVTMPSKLGMQTFIGEQLMESMEEEFLEITWNPTVDESMFRIPEMKLALDAPEVKEAPEAKALVLVHEGAYETIGTTFKKVWQIATDAGLMTSPMTPTMVIYVTDPTTVKDPSELRSEVWLPATPPPGKPMPALPETVTMRDLPGAKVASIAVRGAYGTVEEKSIGALVAWLTEKGHEVVGPPRQLLLHSPEGTVPEDQVSVFQIPVK